MDSLQMQVPSGSGGATITVEDEGIVQSTTVTTLNFTGSGVTASGGGATVTVDVSGGVGGLTLAQAMAISTYNL